jgi:hypothetical protein
MVRAPGISRRFFFPWNVVSDQDFVNAEIQCGLQSRSITRNVRVHAARVRSLLDYVIDNGQLEYDWGDLTASEARCSLRAVGWCLGITQRTTVMGRIVGKPEIGQKSGSILCGTA